MENHTMPEKYRCSFDKKGEGLALLTPDGRLRIWKTKEGKLSQELNSASSLKATCTCLCWTESGRKTVVKSKKKRQRKSEDRIQDNKESSIILGSNNGSLFIFDITTAEVTDTLRNSYCYSSKAGTERPQKIHQLRPLNRNCTTKSGGHNEQVNAVCFCGERGTVYSCSNDKHIVEWSYSSLEVISKWKADKHNVRTLKVGPGEKTLLSAGRTIKLWNLENKELLQRFTGHLSPVSSLIFAPVRSTRNCTDSEIDGQYFLSSAEDDRLVNAWHIHLSSPEKNSIASFMLSENPVAMDITACEDEVKPITLCVACCDGRVHLFSHALNGKIKKPVNATKNIQLTTHGRKNKEPSPIPILGAKFVADDKLSILLVYGSPVKPCFERIDCSTLDDDTTLKRELAENLLLKEKDMSSKGDVKETATVGKEYAVLGNVPVAQPVVSKGESSSEKGEDINKLKKEELSLEERLRSASSAPGPSSRSQRNRYERPTAASMVQMLVQGLHSDDQKLIDNVLYQASKQTVVKTTVQRLPMQFVLPLMNKVVTKIHQNPARAQELTTWIKSLMTIHMTYLMSVPNLVQSVGGLYHLLESRTNAYSKLSKLHGRLDLLLSHAAENKKPTYKMSDFRTPLVTYHDGDSDEDMELDDLETFGKGHGASDSEEDWNPSDDEIVDIGQGSDHDEEESSEDDESSNEQEDEGDSSGHSDHEPDSDNET